MDMSDDEKFELLRSIRSMHGGSSWGSGKNNGTLILGIISICVTVILSALAIMNQISSFGGEMREWKRATDERLKTSDEWKRDMDARILQVERSRMSPAQ